MTNELFTDVCCYWTVLTHPPRFPICARCRCVGLPQEIGALTNVRLQDLGTGEEEAVPEDVQAQVFARA